MREKGEDLIAKKRRKKKKQKTKRGVVTRDQIVTTLHVGGGKLRENNWGRRPITVTKRGQLVRNGGKTVVSAIREERGQRTRHSGLLGEGWEGEKNAFP